jgi:hypothetical protein
MTEPTIDSNAASKKASGNSGAPPQTEPIAPVTVGDIADVAAFVIDQKSMEDYANADMQPGTVECRRPPKGAYFTVRPEPDPQKLVDRGFFFVLEMEGRDPHLVTRPVAEVKKDDEDTIRPILLVRFVLMNGAEGLWPVKLNPTDGKSNKWNTSAMNVLKIAETGKWVRIISKGEYRYNVSKKTMDEVPPKFSERTFQQLIDEAFPLERRVATLNHPIWDELANGSTK